MTSFISKLFRNRRLLAVAFVAVLVFMTIPSLVNAQNSAMTQVTSFTSAVLGLNDITQKFVSSVVFLFSYLISLIAGVIIAIQSWFLEIILHMSFDLVNSAPVRIGFPIVLAMANLFFVGGLIVIAIATITRQVEYGVKKVLWKLVVMAVMVNFGLVICGSLLSISDETTKFFIESVSPGAGSDQNIFKFADSIAGAFNPRASFITTDIAVQNPALTKNDLSFFSAAGDDIGRTVKPIVGLFSTIGSLVIIIITLATLNLMLLWRYVRLGIMLIVLPLAWAAWIFPTYQEHYKKWWTKFTQLAIFPPVVVFFIWIGLKTSEVMSDRSGEYSAIWESQRGDGLPNPISSFLGALIEPVVSQTLKSFILFGIMMGGLVAAQTLGIKFADAGYKAVEGAGKGAKTWANRKFERPKAAAQRGAMRTGGRIASWAERNNLPFMNKKWGLNDKGKLARVAKAPEEKLSSVLNTKADNNRDAMEERLNGPGGSLKQRWHEPLNEWQARLAKKDKRLEAKKTDGAPGESDADWDMRFNAEAGKLIQNDPSLDRGDNEDYKTWKDRLIAAHPNLKQREATEGVAESPDDWKKRVNGAIEELVKKAEGKKGGGAENKGLLASMWSGATKGFEHGASHKHLSKEDINKALKALGVEIPHDEEHHDAHPPAPAGGGGASHGPAPAH